MVESDASSDTDQEIFYPYHSAAERVYATADIGLTPKDRYERLMGCCTTNENVGNCKKLCANLDKYLIGDESWIFGEIF